jgi:hypothetical protein
VKRPSRNDKGLTRADAKAKVDVPCDHDWWNTLNAKLGCIHADHGPVPFPLSDHHSGLRLVAGVPTRFVTPKPKGT